MLHQECQQLVHLSEVRAVEHEFAILCSLDQPGVCQLLHMKRQGGCRQCELFADFSDGHAIAASHDEQTEDGKARRLGQCSKRDDGVF